MGLKPLVAIASGLQSCCGSETVRIERLKTNMARTGVSGRRDSACAVVSQGVSCARILVPTFRAANSWFERLST